MRQGAGFEPSGKQAPERSPTNMSQTAFPRPEGEDNSVPRTAATRTKGLVEAADVPDLDSDKHMICKLWLNRRWLIAREMHTPKGRDRSIRRPSDRRHRRRQISHVGDVREFVRVLRSSHALVSRAVRAYSVEQLFGTFETMSIRELERKPAFAAAVLRRLEAIILLVTDDSRRIQDCMIK